MTKAMTAQQRLVKWREDGGMSLDEAGKHLKMSREYVRRIEAGFVVPVKYETRANIEAATGIEMSAWEPKR